MPEFLCQPLADLTRQLLPVNAERRRAQIERIEKLYWEIEPEGFYTFDQLTYMITGYRPDSRDGVSLVGEPVRNDLLLMADELSDSLDEQWRDFDSPPVNTKDLAKRLQVSTKSISRYRAQGLFTRRVVYPDGRKRPAFTEANIKRFLDHRSQRADRAAKFSRIDDATRAAIVTDARAAKEAPEASLFRVARDLAAKHNRSVEAIRQLLHAHDQQNPDHPLFPEHAPPLTDKQQRIIHRAYHRGISVAKLAKRFNKTRDAIYRAINQRRAKAIQQLNIRFIDNQLFHTPVAEQFILENETAPDPADDPASTSDQLIQPAAPPDLPGPLNDALDLPPLTPDQEQELFIRYNYLKFLAHEARKKLDTTQLTVSQLDGIQTLLRRAAQVKQQIALASLRQVLTFARLHRASAESEERSLVELMQSALPVLLERIDLHDVTETERFQTDLSWAVMRHFGQTNLDPAEKRLASARANRRIGLPRKTKQPHAFRRSAPGVEAREYWPIALDPALAALSQTQQSLDTLDALLADLDEAERTLITRHLGLASDIEELQTLAETAGELDISPENARRIERRAMKKIRSTAQQHNLKIPEVLQKPY